MGLAERGCAEFALSQPMGVLMAQGTWLAPVTAIGAVFF